jgi:hypothetical protein
LDREHFHILSVPRLLRAVRLKALPKHTLRPGHLLVALSDATTDTISKFLEYVWNLGLEGVEVAFLRNPRHGTPSHLIKLHALQRAEAFHAFCESFPGKLELYTPNRTDRRDSRFYTLFGHRFPVPGLEQLADLDRELVLLRPKNDGRVTEWITFAAGEVNFFRRAYDFVDLEIALDETPLVELREDVAPVEVPLELALVARPKTGPARLWQIDKQIDRQRRGLLDLERLRATLVAGELDEVYFAYRFEQPDKDQLNPRLIRLMQQRIGTLSHYDYAFCEPRRGHPYHLVIANRTQRQLGFSLQLADAVYYQPASWRRWGLNLYVPLHSELAPRIDDNDALPLLQRIVEGSDRSGRSDGAPVPAAECAAILWEPGRDGEIDETRVARSAPLLSQFRLLNLFQRHVAALAEQATRQQLADGIRAARQRVEDQLDLLTRELLEHVDARTTRLEHSYAQLERALASAEGLVAQVEPRLDEIRQLVLTLPDEWIKFVNGVFELHRSFVGPQLEALAEVRETVHVGKQQLRALAARGQDLSATAEKHRVHLETELNRCEETIAGHQQSQADLEKLHLRATRVFREISGLHKQLGQRLARIKKLEEEAAAMQQEIDQIKERDKKARQRHEQLKPLLAEYQQKAVQIDKQQETLNLREQTLLRQSLDLAERREQLKQRTRQVTAQLQQLEQYLATFVTRATQIEQASEQVTEQLELVGAHAQAIEMWDAQRQSWRDYLDMQYTEEDHKVAEIRRRLTDLETRDQDRGELREHVRRAQEHLARADALRQKHQRNSDS